MKSLLPLILLFITSCSMTESVTSQTSTSGGGSANAAGDTDKNPSGDSTNYTGDGEKPGKNSGDSEFVDGYFSDKDKVGLVVTASDELVITEGDLVLQDVATVKVFTVSGTSRPQITLATSKVLTFDDPVLLDSANVVDGKFTLRISSVGGSNRGPFLLTTQSTSNNGQQISVSTTDTNYNGILIDIFDEYSGDSAEQIITNTSPECSNGDTFDPDSGFVCAETMSR